MDFNLYQTLGQVSSDDAGQIFRDHLRGFVREMISEVMAAEVTELCGPKHKPSGGEYVRAGSSSGRVLGTPGMAINLWGAAWLKESLSIESVPCNRTSVLRTNKGKSLVP